MCLEHGGRVGGLKDLLEAEFRFDKADKSTVMYWVM